MRYDYPIQVPIMVVSEDQLQAVYAVLAGAPTVVTRTISAEQAADEAFISGDKWPPQEAERGGQVSAEPAADDVEVDSAGVPFDAERHTGTKLKSGLWRMKKGFERPEDDAKSNGSTSTASTGETGSSQSEDAPTEDAGPATDEDDEFAAFREAAAESEAAVASPAVREWSDADLGSLLNQAALKLGGADAIKAKMAEFVPDGAVVHSRQVPADRREEFAQQIEKLADIEFAG